MRVGGAALPPKRVEPSPPAGCPVATWDTCAVYTACGLSGGPSRSRPHGTGQRRRGAWQGAVGDQFPPCVGSIQGYPKRVVCGGNAVVLHSVRLHSEGLPAGQRHLIWGAAPSPRPSTPLLRLRVEQLAAQAARGGGGGPGGGQAQQLSRQLGRMGAGGWGLERAGEAGAGRVSGWRRPDRRGRECGCGRTGGLRGGAELLYGRGGVKGRRKLREDERNKGPQVAGRPRRLWDRLARSERRQRCRRPGAGSAGPAASRFTANPFRFQRP